MLHPMPAISTYSTCERVNGWEHWVVQAEPLAFISEKGTREVTGSSEKVYAEQVGREAPGMWEKVREVLFLEGLCLRSVIL